MLLLLLVTAAPLLGEPTGLFVGAVGLLLGLLVGLVAGVFCVGERLFEKLGPRLRFRFRFMLIVGVLFRFMIRGGDSFASFSFDTIT